MSEEQKLDNILPESPGCVSEAGMNKKKKVINVLKNVLSKKDEILFAYLHGSFLDGFLFNDIDIAIYLDEKRTHHKKNPGYQEQLSFQLSELTRFVVDVHIMNQAPVGFKHSVFKHGQLLFSKDEELRSDLIEETSLEYMDFFELSKQYIKDMVYDGH
ncbi:MAG: nucleotidyltransferase domain-containing protein [Candidatus Aminicenantes bacterium]|nr:MAG: nucleotidyltransferase domain-containing protein [Candidatus Aminicenantes bacterium]